MIEVRFRYLACAMALVASTASAQWSVVNLHPAGALESFVHGVAGGQQAGEAYISFTTRAILWSGTASSWVSLHPAGANASQAHGVGGGQQVGNITIAGGYWRASLWSGTAASWVDLHPAGATDSSWAYGVDGGQIVGYTSIGLVEHASLWTGTAASWVDLTPAGATGSRAYGVEGGQQVGTALVGGTFHASLWSGTAASWVNLAPAGATQSEARGVGGGQQVGYAAVGGVWRASLWTGTAASWVDLTPAGATGSEARGVGGGQQVGYAAVGGVQRASLWSGTAASWVDLHGILPAAFTFSHARGISHVGGFTYVVGRGINSATGRDNALLWVFNGAVLPTQYTLVFGFPVSGNLQSLHFSDDDRLVATVDTASEALNPVWIETRGTCPIANPSSVQLVVEALADLDGRWTYLRMFDYVANQWVDVHGGSVNTLEATITVTVSGNASRFVHPTTREMRAQLLFQDGTAETLQPVTISVDRAMWIVRP